MEISKIMFALLRSALHGTYLEETTKKEITPQVLREIYKLAKKHDVLHLVARALELNDLLFEERIKNTFLEQQHVAVFRVEQIEYELEEICKVFREVNIEYLPLKGAVIRKYYPQPWYRTCCDIDILVKEEKLDAAVLALSKKLGYTNCGKAYHDVSMLSPGGVHLELHFSILEKQENIDGLLSSVWEHVYQTENECEYRMSNEFLLFHVIAHSSYHFLHGGCGIRPVLDLYVLQQHMPYDKDEVAAMVQACALTKYSEGLTALAKAWFEGEPLDERFEDMQAYILCGGIYGNLQNRVAVEHAKAGGKCRYLWRRIFMPYKDLKEVYPSLKGKKWLTPFYQIRRWGKILFGGRLKRSVQEVKISAAVAQEDKQRVKAMMQDLDLL